MLIFVCITSRKDLVGKTNKWAADLGIAPANNTGPDSGGLRFIQGYISEEAGRLEEGDPDVRAHDLSCLSFASVIANAFI